MYLGIFRFLKIICINSQIDDTPLEQFLLEFQKPELKIEEELNGQNEGFDDTSDTDNVDDDEDYSLPSKVGVCRYCNKDHN